MREKGRKGERERDRRKRKEKKKIKKIFMCIESKEQHTIVKLINKMVLDG